MRPFLFLLIAAPLLTYAQKTPFAGERLLVLSDADMVASAYVDGKLDRHPRVQDSLTVYEAATGRVLGRRYVTNAVTAWPKPMVLSPNGRTAFVVALKAPLADTVQQVPNVAAIPNSPWLYALDVTEPDRMPTLDSVVLGNPSAVVMRSQGDLLAAVGNQPGEEITLVEWKEGRFGRVHRLDPFRLLADKPRLTDLSWHPSGEYLAFTLEEAAKVGLFRLVTRNGGYALELVGEPLPVGKQPGIGQFTPDGNHYLVTDLKWQSLPQVVPGELFSVRFALEGTGVHRIVSSVPVGGSPEAVAISPDGRQIVTVNMEASFFPQATPLYKPGCSLSLVRLDPRSGRLRAMGKPVPYAAILPESAVFDRSGRHLAVVSYDTPGQGPGRQGQVSVWQVAGNALRPTATSWPVPRGAHFLLTTRP